MKKMVQIDPDVIHQIGEVLRPYGKPTMLVNDATFVVALFAKVAPKDPEKIGAYEGFLFRDVKRISEIAHEAGLASEYAYNAATAGLWYVDGSAFTFSYRFEPRWTPPPPEPELVFKRHPHPAAMQVEV